MGILGGGPRGPGYTGGPGDTKGLEGTGCAGYLRHSKFAGGTRGAYWGYL